MKATTLDKINEFIESNGYVTFVGGVKDKFDWFGFKRQDGVWDYWNGDLTERIDK